jgi:hypothetical protein
VNRHGDLLWHFLAGSPAQQPLRGTQRNGSRNCAACRGFDSRRMISSVLTADGSIAALRCRDTVEALRPECQGRCRRVRDIRSCPTISMGTITSSVMACYSTLCLRTRTALPRDPAGLEPLARLITGVDAPPMWSPRGFARLSAHFHGVVALALPPDRSLVGLSGLRILSRPPHLYPHSGNVQ